MATEFVCQFGNDAHAARLERTLTASGLELSGCGRSADSATGQGLGLRVWVTNADDPELDEKLQVVKNLVALRYPFDALGMMTAALVFETGGIVVFWSSDMGSESVSVLVGTCAGLAALAMLVFDLFRWAEERRMTATSRGGTIPASDAGDNDEVYDGADDRNDAQTLGCCKWRRGMCQLTMATAQTAQTRVKGLLGVVTLILLVTMVTVVETPLSVRFALPSGATLHIATAPGCHVRVQAVHTLTDT